MLILTRKANESILIGPDTRITVLDCSPSGTVRLAIDAPRHLSILREELAEAALSNKEAVRPDVLAMKTAAAALLPRLKG